MTPREERAEATDRRLRSLLAASAPDSVAAPPGIAVVAHGGYGRRELSPHSDLDVLLVVDERIHHSITDEVATVADRMWYPLWDDGTRLDHSVRTVEQTREAAAADIRTALSMIDARHVAGDPALTLRLRTTVLADWRRTAPRRLPDLERACAERAERVGELAALLEPDLKEAHGGLRDQVVLRALAATWLVDMPHALLARLRSELLDVRDALHEVASAGSGRGGDRLLAQWQDDVAHRLGLSDRDALLRSVFSIGRAVTHLMDAGWRRVRYALERRRTPRPRRPGSGPLLTPLTAHVVEVDGEVGLAPDAPIGSDPLLALRAAHAAASRGLLLSPYAAERLRRGFVPLPTPWPAAARRLLTGLLGTGPGLLPVWETLDQAGLIEGWLPEWAAVRCAPQYSPVHKFTVDRHLLHTCAAAAELLGTVSRPDLLLVSALLHDIGKDGAAGPEHPAVGARIAQRIVRRMGFDDPDVATICGLVRNHLLLIETATGRDPDDPLTGKRVAMEVGDADTLDLLAALTEADARATSGAAWTAWRARLLARLVGRVRARLDHGSTPRPAGLEPWQAELADRVTGADHAVVVASGNQVTVAAVDRIGLLATVAGVLAETRLSVRAAAVHTVEDAGGRVGSVGLSVWWVEGDSPSAAVLSDRIRSILSGGPPSRVEASGSAGGPVVQPTVRVVAGASATATVLEVRARDETGLFHRICAALADRGCSIRSAHVDTLAGTAVDVFYLDVPAGLDAAELCADVRRRIG